MKTSIVCLLFFIDLFVFSCGVAIQEENKRNAPASFITLHVANENKALIDTKQSVIEWKGFNTFGSHAGYVYVAQGELIIKNGQLVSGKVDVDMNTIEDEKHENNSGLIKHLKDPDFFDVKKFPFAAIVITGFSTINAEDKEISGNLTIKGITHPVSFPAKIVVKDGGVKATGKLVIDRTKWGVRYGSTKFFDNLKDQTISDNIEFNIKIVAKNKS